MVSKMWRWAALCAALVGCGESGGGGGGDAPDGATTPDAAPMPDAAPVADAAAPDPDAAAPCRTLGCRCEGDAGCDEGTCTDGVCAPAACVDGTAGCPCDAGACAEPLRCVEDRCVDEGEMGGGAGEACLEGDRCRRGNRCQDGVCLPCRLGSQSCGCKDDDSCNAGLACDGDGVCVSGLSLNEGGLSTCATPCTRGFTQADGAWLECPESRLLDGCYGSTVCVEGQCLVDGDAPHACAVDADCPEFQACRPAADGGFRCLSDCEGDDQCTGGAVCHRRVCRLPCAHADADTCPPSTFCDAPDGQSGHCMPLPTATDHDVRGTPVEYAVSADTLDLSAEDEARFTLTNLGRSRARFILLKAEHRLDGEETVRLVAPGVDPLTVDDCGEACPLPFLEIGDGREFRAGFRYVVELEGGASTEIVVRAAAGVSRWSGALEIHHESADTKRIQLAYAQEPAGRWAGTMLYFGDFEADGVDAWVADRGATQGIRNALVRYFAQFRAGTVRLEELTAALIAAREETWRSPAVQALCAAGSVCFPYDNRDGFLVFSNNPNIEVPSGPVELPFAITVRADGDDPRRLVGRIESTSTLQYAGNPAIQLTFEDNPATCDGGGDCTVHLAGLEAETVVGGRYFPERQACADGFEAATLPWLVPGFAGRSRLDAATGGRIVDECRDARAPTGTAATDTNLARANPLPDGRQRRRRLELVDGFLRNRTDLIVLFRETSTADEAGAEDLVAYGFLVLHRMDTEVGADDTRGEVPAVAEDDSRLVEARCGDAVLSALGTSRAALEGGADDEAFLDALGAKLVGLPADGGGRLPELAWPKAVHSFCEDSGYFDGGPADDGSPDALTVECPEGSRVTFFTLRADEIAAGHDARDHQEWMARRACQATGADLRGTCGATLEEWLRTGAYGIEVDPFWRCADGGHPSTCDDDRNDLRAGKTFFEAVDLPLPPFRSAVRDAFRYRTRFASRTGDELGFAPTICEGRGDGISYCYEPAAIEALAERADCAVEVYTRFGAGMSEGGREALATYLEEHFGYVEETDAFGRSLTVRGFEPLYAELLIMLGDEAYTEALTSRFDLAGARVKSFAGDLFEADGMRLSGIAGAEMVALHTAVQHYQLALDRFTTLLPALERDIARAAAPNARASVVDARTLTTYVDRLVRASTQKARAESQIADRYEKFDRSDLSRRVIERAYTAAYLESSLFGHLMNRLVEVSDRADRDQIRSLVRKAQTTYRGALAQMREAYLRLGTAQSRFGFSPDYVPFPTVELGRDNPFEVALFRARDRLTIAAQAEQLAIESDRSFNTDQASFENELTRIRNTYEGQLLELCGGIEVEGVVYPAIPQYADLTERTLLMGDPCGLTGSGSIHDAVLEERKAGAQLRQVRTQIDNVTSEARIEENRWKQQCAGIRGLRDYTWTMQGAINDAESLILELEQENQKIQREMQVNLQQAGHVACEGFSCLTGAVAVGAEAGIYAVYKGYIADVEEDIREGREYVADLQQSLQRAQFDAQCDQVRIDGMANVQRILLRAAELKLEALQATLSLEQASARLRQLRLQARRVQQELEETLENAINVEAAKNNPNVRIYRSDAVINADYTFQSALRQAYAATRVLEFYTSQSYAGLADLFLVRMATRGDFNLQNYLIELEDAFREFEDHYGQPNSRVLRLSLKDDLFGIPLLDEAGRALDADERNALFVQRLTDRGLLDENGHVVVPFDTTSDMLSPLTRNHQIKYVSAQFVGNELNDIFSRVYLRMAGTSSILPLGDDATPAHYRFPERLAVIDAYQGERKNATQIDDEEVYRSRTLTSRPLLNTQWEMILNMVDEPANDDFALENLTDVRLYFYYTDFVEF